jgi:hypothetical protein
VDEQVQSDDASNARVARGMEQERRLPAAEWDAAVYAADPEPDDLDELATWASSQPIELD